MLEIAMQRIMQTVCRRARRHGFIRPEDVRAALTRAGLPACRWREIVSLAGDMLSDRDGYLYYRELSRDSCWKSHRGGWLSRAVRQLASVGKSLPGADERRRQGRFDFVHPVQVEMEEGRVFTLLSCDVSPRGIRVVAPFSLLGKRIRVVLPDNDRNLPKCFYARVVWSTLVGDGLYENGAAFIDGADPYASGQSSQPLHLGGSVATPLTRGEVPAAVPIGGQPRVR